MKYIFTLLCFLSSGYLLNAQIWTTNADQSTLLQKSNYQLASVSKDIPVIAINEKKTFQPVDGFGFTLTGGSAMLINRMSDAAKESLLQELFGKGEESIGISYLRISIGASDLDSSVFSYDDLLHGKTDESLSNFSLSKDADNLIPLLQAIIKINPTIKIMGSPWSPPTWMKDNGKSKGGHLLLKFYDAYAHYFLKYILEMKKQGISIDAITLQNEPQHGGNNPSMLMTATEQANFVANHLGPLFQKNNIETKIIVWDHNCDHPEYPIAVLNNSMAKKYIDGSAFHLYNGDISALTEVKNAHPDKKLYFTEQWTGSKGSFDGDFMWHVKNVVIGSMKNWSSVALEWNLANDPKFEPHTPGGCTECKGALTIDGSSIERNVAYYIIAQASKFVASGSIRIESTSIKGLENVAFLRPDGKLVLIMLNEKGNEVEFAISFRGKSILSSMKPSSAASFVLE
jgi:glucosylceramidase